MNKKIKRANSIHRKKQRIVKSRIKEQKAKAQAERKTKTTEQNVKAVQEQVQEKTPVEPAKDTASSSNQA